MRNSGSSTERGARARSLFAHLLMIVALVVLVCFVTDQINPDMAFISSPLSKWIIGIFSVLAIIHSIWTIVALWVRPDERDYTRRMDDR